MIRPPRGSWPAMWRKASRAQRKAPVTLTPNTFSQSSRATSATGAGRAATPALLNRRSIRPNRAAAAANSARTEASSVTSHNSAASVSPPSAQAVSSASRRRPAIMTCQPAFASARAVARPTPLPPPVTIALPIIDWLETRADSRAQGHRPAGDDIGPLEALAAFLETGQLGALVERILDEELGGE